MAWFIIQCERKTWTKYLNGEELEELAKKVIVQPQGVIERMKWVLGRE